MIVKALPAPGTTMHVWDRKKYYPGTVHLVGEELGELLIKKGIAEKVKDSPKPAVSETAAEAPKPNVFKRGPGRPRKNFG